MRNLLANSAVGRMKGNANSTNSQASGAADIGLLAKSKFKQPRHDVLNKVLPQNKFKSPLQNKLSPAVKNSKVSNSYSSSLKVTHTPTKSSACENSSLRKRIGVPIVTLGKGSSRSLTDRRPTSADATVRKTISSDAIDLTGLKLKYGSQSSSSAVSSNSSDDSDSVKSEQAHNDARIAINEFEEKLLRSNADRTKLSKDLQQAYEERRSFEDKYRRELRETLLLRSQISEYEVELQHSKELYKSLERKMAEEQSKFKAQELEWEQFKSDLLVAVRVSDEIAQDAKAKAKIVRSENDALNHKIMLLEGMKSNKPHKQLLRHFDNTDGRDPLSTLVKVTGGCSRRNALLEWCKNRISNYADVKVTNFSTSWDDGMALCALLHSFLPDQIPFDQMKPDSPKNNFQVAFRVAESAGIPTTLDIEEMLSEEPPSWEKVMTYITSIYSHLELHTISGVSTE